MNKIRLSIFCFLALITAQSIAGVIVVEGNYQGKNLYIQNPFGSSGVGFCVYEVRVNNQITTDEINSSAFEVDFKNFQLKLGDKVEIQIKYKDGCLPKVLNAQVLKPKSTFEVVSIKADKDGNLKWVTKAESGKLPYVIEQYRWNKWIKINELEGQGSNTANEYTFKVPYHSGKNQFRVKQIDYTGQAKISTTANFVAQLPEVTFSPVKVSKSIFFSQETMFEIYDQYGTLIKKDTAKEIDVSTLQKGIYYINYDNKMEEFIKK